jgi:ribonuclease R
MQDYVGEEFDAVVSGVASFGFWAETVAHKCEGMVPMSDLYDIDEFELMEGEYALIGRRTKMRFGVGDKVKVRVVSTNLEKRQIDFSLVEVGEAKPQRKATTNNKQQGRKSGDKKKTGRKK